MTACILKLYGGDQALASSLEQALHAAYFFSNSCTESDWANAPTKIVELSSGIEMDAYQILAEWRARGIH